MIINKQNKQNDQLKKEYVCGDVIFIIIKRVQGCSQSDALKWVTCALFIFSLTCTECKKCAAKKHNCTACDPVADSLDAKRNALPRSDCMQCIWHAALVYLFTIFNRFVGLFGIITFDPFYQTNNTLISSCISGVATWFRTFTMLCKPNSPAPPPPPPPPARSVRIIVNVLNACCTAANAFRCVYY